MTRSFPLADSDLPEHAWGSPDRTPEGEAWVRWIRVGDQSGWVARGTRPPKFRSPGFWEQVFLLACPTGNERMDATHALGESPLSIGPLGFTVTSGYAQGLLHACFMHHPDVYMRAMLPLINVTAVHVFESELAPGGFAFVQHGDELISAADLCEAIRPAETSLGGRAFAKERSRLWVSKCSRLLRDARFDQRQVEHLSWMLPDLLTERSRRILLWPAHGVSDAFGWTAEQRALWATALVLALRREKEANEMVEALVLDDPIDARKSLQSIRTTATGFEDDFARDVVHTVTRASEIFKVELS